MREGWAKKQIKEVSTVVTGTTPSSKDVGNWGGSVPFLTPSDMGAHDYAVITSRSLSKESAERMRNRIISSEATAVVCIGATIGKVARVTKPTLTNQQINTIVPTAGKLDPKFSYYVLGSLSEHLFQIASGSATPLLNKSRFENVELILPPFYEQQQIGKVLGSFDDLIQLNKGIMSQIEQTLASLFSALEFDTAGPKPISLSDLIEVNPKRANPGGIVSFIDMASLPTDSARVGKVTLRESGSGSKFMNGDTIMARITPCLENGKTAFVDVLQDDEIAFGSTEFIVLRSRDHIPACWTYFLARSERFREYAVRHMSGTSGRQRCSAEDIQNYQISSPSIEKLETFSRHAALFSVIKELDEECQNIIKTRDELLPLLLSGEITVKDVVA